MQHLGNDNPLLLRPKLSPEIQSFLSESELIRQLITAFGSPLNLMFPDSVEPNLRAFHEVLSRHKLNHRIFFAHKSNQSHSLLAQMACTTLGVDVASEQELQHALSKGFTGSRIEATGPKNSQFLYLSLMHDVVINVDSIQELTKIIEIKQAMGIGSKTKILLRLCDFKAPRMQLLAKQSRFGIRVEELEVVLEKVVQFSLDLDLIGFSFHLDSISLEERVVAIENCIQAIERAVDIGLEARVINIGGHFRINYLSHADDWHQYTTAIKEAALGVGQQVTWQNNHFGLSSQGGTLKGKFNSYGYFEDNPGAALLNQILESKLPAYDNKTVAMVLRSNMIDLWLEPGRALLDQAGVTLARVNSPKLASSGETLVLLDMKRSDIAFLDQEVFVDPVLVSGNHCSPDAKTSIPVYFAGNLCLENDLIYRHLTYLPELPNPGDVIAFVNTAAYMMDFSASNTAMNPPAKRVAVYGTGKSFEWALDECYSPIQRLIRTL